ncbi:MAG: hypothetical protein ABSG71_12575 [Thermodesulfobacteriota bacterium]|jgi:hypothetical protein
MECFFLKSSKIDFHTIMKSTTDNQQFPKTKKQGHWEWRSAMVNLNGHETGSGGYSQGDT